MKNLILGAAMLALPTTALASFNWGADCSSGYGDFTQYIPWYDTIEVGGIPSGKTDVTIYLESDTDVDIQLIDDLTGTEIIAWPNGLLNGADADCVDFQGLTYCYSGYNGDGTVAGLGYEWISITGTTNRPLTMKAFGYEDGEAFVDYSWDAGSSCHETGEGDFLQYIPFEDTVLVGDIPTGKSNLVIDLDAWNGKDVDVQLWDGNTPLIAWPHGLLAGPTEEEIYIDGMRIIYSGYNGINGNWGHERIEIYGEVPYDLTMYAFGYESGTADVTYAWGIGVGDTCSSDWDCMEGTYCKNGDASYGACHTLDWCESTWSAADDCAGVPHAGGAGYWICPDYQCTWTQIF